MTISRTHRQCVGRLLGLLPANAGVLDVPCGTGEYWGILLGAGCDVFGVDASVAALAAAHALYPDVPTQLGALDDLPFEAAFDGALCIEGLEHVAHAARPRVLSRLHRALRGGGVAYITLPLGRRADLDAAHAQVHDAGFRVEDELRGDGRDHLLARRR